MSKSRPPHRALLHPVRFYERNFSGQVWGGKRDQPAGELVVLSLAMIILTFQRVRSLASTLLSTPRLPSSQISFFRLNMFLSPVELTWNSEESPSMRQVRVRGASSAIEDCCGVLMRVECCGVFVQTTCRSRSLNILATQPIPI